MRRAILAGLLLGGCAKPVDTTAPVAEVSMLPTPYTAEQIREAMPAGSRLTLLQREPGKADVSIVWTVVAATHDTVTIEEQVDQAPSSSTDTYRWTDLRDHARFDARTTTRAPQTWTDQTGERRGWRYTRRTSVQGISTVHTFIFDERTPGPPAQMRIEVDGQTQLERFVTERIAPPPRPPQRP